MINSRNLIYTNILDLTNKKRGITIRLSIVSKFIIKLP